jgi:hypothetical protein
MPVGKVTWVVWHLPPRHMVRGGTTGGRVQEISAISATFNVDRHNDRLTLDALRSTVRQIGKVARSSFNHARRLLVRFEKPHGCYLALVHLAAAIIMLLGNCHS